jgi:hypothetical protein
MSRQTLTPCLECGKPTAGSRCAEHPNPNDLARHRSSYTKTRQAFLDAWRARHGNWCPGAEDLDHQPHPSSDLTVDHIDGDAWNDYPANWRVLCRQKNSAKR